MKQLVVHIRTHLKALQVLGQPTDKWDTIIIHMAKNKLDFRLQHAWEEEVSQRGTDYMPAMEEFLQFLSEKCRTWQMLDNRGKEESHLKGNATSSDYDNILKAIKLVKIHKNSIRQAALFCFSTITHHICRLTPLNWHWITALPCSHFHRIALTVCSRSMFRYLALSRPCSP